MAVRKLDKKNYKIGQTVALRNDGNRVRYDGRNNYTLGEVTKVGSKILHIGEIKIDMETGYQKSNYSPDYQLYDSEQDVLDAIEGEKIISKIKSTFSYGDVNVSIDKLRQIKAILDME